MYVGETFISCVFVCGQQGNGRRGENKQKCLVGPWALVGRALTGQALMGRALMGSLGPSGPDIGATYYVAPQTAGHPSSQ